MTAEPPTAFWDRVGVSEVDRLRCLSGIHGRYPGYTVEEFGDQGYCSLTLLVCDPRERQPSAVKPSDEGVQYNEGRIVQIRPAHYALDMRIARAAKETYPSRAPSIRSLDLNLPGRLCAYEMQIMHGTPLCRVLPQSMVLDSTLRQHECLIESFAAAIGEGLPPAQLKDRSARADSPMEDAQSMLLRSTGRVGSSIVWRLEKLCAELPGENLKRVASDVLAGVRAMGDYPVVLNHGDLIPSNILVEEDTWEITGLVDWAEAEYLPFGTCFYGLEHLLGYMSTTQHSTPAAGGSTADCKHDPAFVYYENASQLRELLWRSLFGRVPAMKSREDDMRVMRKLGILLWYGFAWDDGAIDRVVNEVDDPVEMACLRAFLDVE